MAEFKLLKPFILKWEGGYVNDPLDKGGSTNKGVTIATFRQFYGQKKTVDDLKALTDAQWEHIFKTGYWNKWRADEIKDQAVANALVDWTYHSGIHGIKEPQKILGVTVDGIVGPITIAAVNKMHPQELFWKVQVARHGFVENIVKTNPTQERFLVGWKNRINSLTYIEAKK